MDTLLPLADTADEELTEPVDGVTVPPDADADEAPDVFATVAAIVMPLALADDAPTAAATTPAII